MANYQRLVSRRNRCGLVRPEKDVAVTRVGESDSDSSVGFSVDESLHQTEPCASITPLSLTVIPVSFVNSSH